MREKNKKSEKQEVQPPSEPAYYPLDLRKDVLEKIGERKDKRTLTSLSEYEAVLVSIFTYINNNMESVKPQELVEIYLDYKLSIGSMARKDLIELFKHMVGAPVEQPQQSSEARKKWRLI